MIGYIGNNNNTTTGKIKALIIFLANGGEVKSVYIYYKKIHTMR